MRRALPTIHPVRRCCSLVPEAQSIGIRCRQRADSLCRRRAKAGHDRTGRALSLRRCKLAGFDDDRQGCERWRRELDVRDDSPALACWGGRSAIAAAALLGSSRLCPGAERIAKPRQDLHGDRVPDQHGGGRRRFLSRAGAREVSISTARRAEAQGSPGARLPTAAGPKRGVPLQSTPQAAVARASAEAMSGRAGCASMQVMQPACPTNTR